MKKKIYNNIFSSTHHKHNTHWLLETIVKSMSLSTRTIAKSLSLSEKTRIPHMPFSTIRLRNQKEMLHPCGEAIAQTHVSRSQISGSCTEAPVTGRNWILPPHNEAEPLHISTFGTYVVFQLPAQCIPTPHSP